METSNKLRTDAVHVLIDDKPVWLDIENLRDVDLAKRDQNGKYETENGEQHFTYQNAELAAKKQGKRLLTDDEQIFIKSLPRRWDIEREGYLFTFNRVGGGKVEVFLPASGYRYHTSGALYGAGTYGYYWSASPYSSGGYYASYLYFYSGSVYVSFSNYRADGYSVR
jgi:hypothetical protein